MRDSISTAGRLPRRAHLPLVDRTRGRTLPPCPPSRTLPQAIPPITPDARQAAQAHARRVRARPARARPRADLRRARRLQRHVERALLVQVERASTCGACPPRGRASSRGPARTPASSTSATGSPPSSRWSRTTTRASSSRTRARPPASAASCATSSPWARAPSRASNSLRFGRPDHPRTPELLRGVVAGIGGYGNCIGVPTVGGEVQFDARYDGNILVNAFTCGVARTDRIFYGRASGVGNSDPLHRREDRARRHPRRDDGERRVLARAARRQRPTMQVGDPFMGKLLLEACLELFSEDVLEGIQDMGAAGLTSSSVEMAGRAGNGIELDLDRVPRRAKAMTPYEILLSESQERMLLVAKPGQGGARARRSARSGSSTRPSSARSPTRSAGSSSATPGYDPLVDPPSKRAPVVVCDIPVGVADRRRARLRPPARGRRSARRAARPGDASPVPTDLGRELLELVGSPNVGSRAGCGGSTTTSSAAAPSCAPARTPAVVRVRCERDGKTVEKLLAFAVDCNGRMCELDAVRGRRDGRRRGVPQPRVQRAPSPSASPTASTSATPSGPR